MELREIEAFVVTASTLSFTKAAKQLHRSQPALSQQVRQLEEELGISLFVRTKRSVALSPSGAVALQSAKEILRCREVFIGKLRTDKASVFGRLSVGTTGTGTAYLWARTYQAFACEYKTVYLDVRTTERTQDTLDHVLRGDLDLGFAPVPPKNRNLQFQTLGMQEAILTASVEHSLFKKSSVSVRELSDQAFILAEKRMGMRWLADQFFEHVGIKPRVVLESNDMQMIKAMVEVGFGVAFLPNWSIQRELDEGRVKSIGIPGPRLVQEMGLVFRKSGLTAPARCFLEFCLKRRDLLPKITQS